MEIDTCIADILGPVRFGDRSAASSIQAGARECDSASRRKGYIFKGDEPVQTERAIEEDMDNSNTYRDGLRSC